MEQWDRDITYPVRMLCLPRGSSLVSIRLENPSQDVAPQAYLSAALTREDIFVLDRLAVEVLVNDGGHGGRLSRSARRAKVLGPSSRENVYRGG